MNDKEIGEILLKRGNVLVSFHAVEQFQNRIAKLPEDVVRKIISEGITKSANVKVLPDGRTLRVRTRRPFPFEFRALLVYDEGFDKPVVTTILKGDSWKIRKQRNRVNQG